MNVTIGTSIICMDHLNFQQHTILAEKLGVDYLHLDVMDGSYVPRYGIYPEIVRSLANISRLKMDLHLMVSDPEFALDQFNDIDNIEYVSIHLDGNYTKILRIFDKIRDQSRKPVLVIDLGSNIDHVAQYIRNDLVSGIMFMGIHPGILTQTPRPRIVEKKLYSLKAKCDLEGLFIQCDGGVNFDTIPDLIEAGVNNFVCGSSTLYKDCNFKDPYIKVANKITSNYNKISGLLNV